jgi:dTDP-4-amino-4,6-dideoxygalactose transaminase
MAETETIRTAPSRELALLGARPRFERPLHVGRPNVGDRAQLHARLDEILDRCWLTNEGPLVLELERRLEQLLGVRHVLPICNGTVALELAIRALGLTGEVIVPAFTFVATAHALQWQEITPVFCDVDPATHTLDPERVEQMISSRTSGILGVHLWGRACDVEGLSEVARRHQLSLLFDAAHAFGVSRRGRMIGNFGDCEVFSFHATKVFNTFEGGAIATNDDALAEKLRWMRNFGFSDYDQVDHIGVNGKMTEAAAAMGLVNLDALPAFLEANRRNHARYLERLSRLPGLRVLAYDESEQHNHHYVVVEVTPDAALERDALVDVLHAEGVLARRYFYPGVHRMEPYRSLYPNAGLMLPATEALAEQTLVLPTGSAVSLDAVDAVCEIVEAALARAPEVRAQRAGRRPRAASRPVARPRVHRVAGAR